MSYPKQTSHGQQSEEGYPGKQCGPPPQSYPAVPQGYPQMPPQYGQAAPPPYSAYPPQPQAYPPQPQAYTYQPQAYPQQTVTYLTHQPMASGTYDSGARFDGISRPNVPPPPPGVAPNAAQVAASQGQPALLQQRQSGWLEGGSGAGYTFW
eukprot:gene14128-5122_t